MIPESASRTKSNAPHGPTTAVSNQITIWIWRAVKATVFLLLICSGFLFVAYRSMHKPPDFYRQALKQRFDESEVAGDQFETELLNVQNAIRLQSNWRGVFREAEINGWLVADCPSKFPKFTPDFVESPRIQLLDSKFSYAFRYRPWEESRWFSPFVVIAGDLFVAESSGEIALRIKQVKSGFVPIPIARIANNMTKHLRRNGMEVAWTEVNGDSTALISIPPDKLQLGNKQFQINSIVCRNQAVELNGESKSVAK